MTKHFFAHDLQDLGYHKHLVSLVACITVEQPLALITEYCQHGDLLRLVRTHKESIIEVDFAHDWLLISLQPDENAFVRFRDLLSFAWQISDGLVGVEAILMNS